MKIYKVITNIFQNTFNSISNKILIVGKNIILKSTNFWRDYNLQSAWNTIFDVNSTWNSITISQINPNKIGQNLSGYNFYFYNNLEINREYFLDGDVKYISFLSDEFNINFTYNNGIIFRNIKNINSFSKTFLVKKGYEKEKLTLQTEFLDIDSYNNFLTFLSSSNEIAIKIDNFSFASYRIINDLSIDYFNPNYRKITLELEEIE